jgi:hypothetical protein
MIQPMQDAFGTIVWVVAVVGAIVAVFTLVGTGRSYRAIGGGGVVRDTDGGDGDDGGRGETAARQGAAGERDEEIRQMLEARNARRVRRGEAPVDVDAEIAALEPAAPADVDDALREEIRAHVVARNARRVRDGLAPLDVEQEIARRIRDLT